MAIEADTSRTVVEKGFLVGGMRVMTAEAFTLLDRLMDIAAQLFFGGILMAGIAKIPYLELNQPGVSGNMRAVTGDTFPLIRRFVPHPLLKGIAFMA